MFLLRETDRSVTDVCLAVSFNSLGTFSRTFRDIVGESPTAYRKRAVRPAAPGCFTMAYSRPASVLEKHRDAAGR
jgi:AraC-like DNA-binding protein